MLLVSPDDGDLLFHLAIFTDLGDAPRVAKRPSKRSVAADRYAMGSPAFVVVGDGVVLDRAVVP